MKDSPAVTIDEAKDLILNLNPEKTIFYFDGLYHTVKNDWLTEIPAEEAERNLGSNEFDLWNLGNPAGPLPDCCPSFIYKNIDVIGSVGQFLQIVFDLYCKKFIINKIGIN
jgi:hypothetical protein